MHKLPRTSFFLIVVMNLVVLGALAGSGCGDKGGAGGSSDGKDAAKYMGGAPPGMAKPGAASSGTSSGAAAKTPPGPSPGGAPR